MKSNVSIAFQEAMKDPVRVLKAQLELADGSVYTELDAIKSIEVQRIGDNTKFYGYGVCQRLNIKLVDLDNVIDPGTGSKLTLKLGVQYPDGTKEYVSFPPFYVSQKNRDEEEELTSLTAYDRLYDAASHLLSEYNYPTSFGASFTTYAFIDRVCEALGLEGIELQNISNSDGALFFVYGDTVMPIAEEDEVIGTDENIYLPNFDGSENLRYALDKAAEAVSCIYYINERNYLVLKRLDLDGVPVLTITPEDYITLDHNENRRVNGVCHVTELGDNVISQAEFTGTIQYIRDNPFWELRQEIADLVNYAAECVVGLSINQFDCAWRGNLTLDVGDKLATVGTDGQVKITYLLDDTIVYAGHLSQATRWEFETSDHETAANPSSLGEALNSTIARVDKINQEILLQAKRIDENISNIAGIVVGTENITAEVEKIQTNVEYQLGEVTENLKSLTTKVESTMSAEDIKFEISKVMDQGVTSVTTTTGFTFNEEGLTVSKTGSEMTTTITEDGMIVYRDDTEMLTADNQGVHAINLTATQYLVVGKNSRFEDYIKDDEERTGCFWIGV